MNEVLRLEQSHVAVDLITPARDNPRDVRCGRVVSTTGSTVIVLLDDRAEGDVGLRMGSLVCFRTADVTIYGIVEGLSTPMPSKNGDTTELHLAEIGLLGEMTSKADAERWFRRGVSQVPALDENLYLANQDDVRNVYSIPDRNQISVGVLHNNASVPACVSIDELLCKHFALLGTTGVGKSCALALILNRILEQSPNGHVLLLDPHGEYGQAFGDRAERLTVDTFRLPFWIANFDELTEIVFGAEKHEMVAEIALLRELIRYARVKYATPADAAWITVDTPVPYSLGTLNSQIDQAMGSLDNKAEIPAYQRIKSRLSVLQTDSRYAFMFDTGLGTRDNFASVLGTLFRMPAQGKPIAVFDLSRIPSEVLNVVVAVVCRIAFDFSMCVGQSQPMLLVCEEAHRYAPRDTALGFEPAKRALSRIAKEGRKYGISLGVISQRPSELASTILSQCSTVFAFRMANERDQEIIQATLSEASLVLFAALPFLGNMEAIAIGEGVPVPMRLVFDNLKGAQRPRSNSALFSDRWRLSDDNSEIELARAVTSLRGQKSGI